VVMDAEPVGDAPGLLASMGPRSDNRGYGPRFPTHRLQ
jgi:hypothetical protein